MVGLARSGAAAARLLAERGEVVRGADQAAPSSAAGLDGLGVEVVLNEQGIELLEGVRTLIKSPGVPRDAPLIRRAEERGTEIMGELELSWRLIPNRFIAVTGTNGKTTTCEWIGHILRGAKRPVAVAGNVGTPLASLVDGLDEDATVVCECSSFQLQDSIRFAPECALFLNLAADHLDRHGNLEDYLAAKLRIFAHQRSEDIAILNGDEPALADRDLGEAREVRFCRAAPGGGDGGCELELQDGRLRWRGEPLIATEELPLIGEHNVENAMAAAAASLALGTGADAVREGLRSFGGVPHRLELVAELEGVSFINDSKATNAASARAALRGFASGVHMILGGRAKSEPFAGLAEAVAERCRACYLIGEAAPLLERELAGAGVPLHRCTDLADAVARAADAARAGEVVLLSPACASYDAYRDFEERGDAFRALVRERLRGAG